MRLTAYSARNRGIPQQISNTKRLPGKPTNPKGGVMSNNSDPLLARYAEMDFSDAKPAAEIPALAKLQAEHGGKSRIMTPWRFLKLVPK